MSPDRYVRSAAEQREVDEFKAAWPARLEKGTTMPLAESKLHVHDDECWDGQKPYRSVILNVAFWLQSCKRTGSVREVDKP